MMSAEIIPFGKPQAVPIKRRRKVRDADKITIGDLIAEYGRAPTTSEIREALDRRRHARRVSETVRLMFDGGLYEIEFYGNDVHRVDAIQYRITADGAQEMKRRHWCNGGCSRFDLDPAIVVAAISARASGRKDDEIPFR
jgi:hypothetical protein